MSPLPNISLQERIPQAEIPSREALDILPRGHSILFPGAQPSHTPPEFGNYNDTEPRPGTPLHPLLRSIKAVTAQTYNRIDNGETERNEAEHTIAAATIQKKLVSSINTAYINAGYAGFPHRWATLMIDDYIETQDQIRHGIYSRKVSDYRSMLDNLRGNVEFAVPGNVVSSAYASHNERLEALGEVPKTEPLSAELKREAYRQALAGKLRKNRLYLERLKFEWVSSMVIVEFLKGTVVPDELALAS